MRRQTPTVKRELLHRKDLAARYKCDLRTIDRDHADGTLPPGRYLRNKVKPFWYLDEIEQNERYKPKLKQRRIRVLNPPAPTQPVQQLAFKI